MIRFAQKLILEKALASKEFYDRGWSDALAELETRTKKVMEAVSTAQGSHKYDSCYEDVLEIINQLKEKR